MTPEQIAERDAVARRLESAINRMNVRYGSAVSESLVGRTAGTRRATRARFRRHAALMRLTRALADLAIAGGAR